MKVSMTQQIANLICDTKYIKDKNRNNWFVQYHRGKSIRGWYLHYKYDLDVEKILAGNTCSEIADWIGDNIEDVKNNLMPDEQGISQIDYIARRW